MLGIENSNRGNYTNRGNYSIRVNVDRGNNYSIGKYDLEI